MRSRFRAKNLRRVEAFLNKAHDDLTASSESILAVLAPEIADSLRSNIQSEGRRVSKTWPPLAKRTVKERIRLGFGAGPMLKRTGALMNEIRRLELTDTFVSVGLESGKGSALDRDRIFGTVPDSDVDEWVTRIIEFHLGGSIR